MTVYCGKVGMKECIEDLVVCNGCTCDFITKNKKKSDRAVKKFNKQQGKTKRVRKKTWDKSVNKWKTIYKYWLFSLIKYEIAQFKEHRYSVKKTYKIAFK